MKTVFFGAAAAAVLLAVFVGLSLHGDVQLSAAACAGIVGACLGSFANVVVYRLPRMLHAAWEQDQKACQAARLQSDGNSPHDRCRGGEGPPSRVDADQRALSLMWPSSACPHCAAPIRCWHNVPVLGFIALGGRCADCAAPISCRYPCVEAFCAAGFAILGWVYGPSFELAAYGCAFTLLLMLALIDWDTQLLPDTLTQPLLWTGLLANAEGLRVTLEDAVMGVVLAYSSFWLISAVYRHVARRDGIGDGDLKLVAALGAWLGWQALPWVMCGAASSSLLATVCLVLNKRTCWTAPQAFGPHLALAACVTAVLL